MAGTSEPVHGSAPRIRRATPGDLDAIVDVYLSNAQHHAALDPRAYRVPPVADVRERFARMLEADDEEDLHLVAEVEGRVVGAADAFRGSAGSPGSMRRPRRSAEVGIGVLEGWRGRGIGTALLATAEAWARGEGIETMLLEVATENEGARSLYDRLGYREVTHQLAKPLRQE